MIKIYLILHSKIFLLYLPAKQFWEVGAWPSKVTHITCSKILQDTKYPKLLDEKVPSYKTYQKGLSVHTLCVNTLQQDSKAEIHVKIKNNEVGNYYKVTWFVDGTFPSFTPSLSSADETFSLFC